MMTTYTLTAAEAARYDSDDESVSRALMTEIRSRYGRVSGGDVPTTEVRHPEGYVIEHYRAE